MIVSYIPRQPLREYKTNNGQKERKMFLFLVMIHLSIMISSFCVWAEFLVLGYVYSGYGTGWNLHCVLVLLYKEPLHPLYGSVSSFGCIVMFIWNLDIFCPFSWFLYQKVFTKKLVHWYSMNKFFVKLSLFSVFVLHKTRTCFSVWVQYNSDWNLCQKLWLCLNILLGWMWEWKHWVNEQMVFDMLLNDLPVSVELFTVINASSHPWMMVEFVWVWHMLSLCIVLSSECVEQW